MKKTEASQFKWAKWKNALYAGLQIATSSCVRKWRLLPVVGNGDFCQWLEMATSSCGLIEGDFCLWFV